MSSTGVVRGVTVEVAGLPGSGKSTVVRAVAAADARVVAAPFADRRRKALALTRSALALAPLLLERHSLASSGRDLGRMVRLDAMPTAGQAVWPIAGAARVFDQGPLFLLHRLSTDPHGEARPSATSAWSERMLGRWAGNLDLVVVLDAPDEILLARVRSRSKDHALKHVTRDDGLAALHRQRQLLELLLSELRMRSTIEVLRIDTASTSLVASTTRALEAIDRVRLDQVRPRD